MHNEITLDNCWLKIHLEYQCIGLAKFCSTGLIECSKRTDRTSPNLFSTEHSHRCCMPHRFIEYSNAQPNIRNDSTQSAQAHVVAKCVAHNRQVMLGLCSESHNVTLVKKGLTGSLKYDKQYRLHIVRSWALNFTVLWLFTIALSRLICFRLLLVCSCSDMLSQY